MRVVNILSVYFFLIFLVFSPAVLAQSETPVSFQDLVSDPPSYIDFADDGYSAAINESVNHFAVLLYLDAVSGDPYDFVPAWGRGIKFDYEFLEGGVGSSELDDDLFQVQLIDAQTHQVLETLRLDTSGTGTHYFDLAHYMGRDLTLTFVLAADFYDAGYDSVVTVSALSIDQEPFPIHILFDLLLD